MRHCVGLCCCSCGRGPYHSAAGSHDNRCWSGRTLDHTHTADRAWTSQCSDPDRTELRTARQHRAHVVFSGSKLSIFKAALVHFGCWGGRRAEDLSERRLLESMLMRAVRQHQTEMWNQELRESKKFYQNQNNKQKEARMHQINHVIQQATSFFMESILTTKLMMDDSTQLLQFQSPTSAHATCWMQSLLMSQVTPVSQTVCCERDLIVCESDQWCKQPGSLGSTRCVAGSWSHRCTAFLWRNSRHSDPHSCLQRDGMPSQSITAVLSGILRHFKACRCAAG